MSLITRRLSVLELSQRILDMAKTGVHRESVFEALHPVATKKQISVAIAHSKKFGLHSVASQRDPTLGTYYELDLVKYQSLQQAIASSAQLDLVDPAELVQRGRDATSTVRLMLTTVKGVAYGLVFIGLVFLVSGKQQASLGMFVSAASAMGIWALQKVLARKLV